MINFRTEQTYDVRLLPFFQNENFEALAGVSGES